ncbi:MAG: hypothetical protein PHN78_00550 [Dehalococcoidales bacterium]|nr:hypothetical protein [Dehalococcoidales bacterium]
MGTQPEELKKLVAIATDLGLAGQLRTSALKGIGHMSTHEALLALLELAANDKLTKGERELALKYARDIIKSGH